MRREPWRLEMGVGGDFPDVRTGDVLTATAVNEFPELRLGDVHKINVDDNGRAMLVSGKDEYEIVLVEPNAELPTGVIDVAVKDADFPVISLEVRDIELGNLGLG